MNIPYNPLDNYIDKPKCEYEYLPDEDGTCYTCGEDESVILTDYGWLCPKHCEFYK